MTRKARGLLGLALLMVLLGLVSLFVRPARGSDGAGPPVGPTPFSYCTTMTHPVAGPGYGVAVCFGRNAEHLELLCITDAEVAAMFRTEYCGRSPPLGVPAGSRPMPVPR